MERFPEYGSIVGRGWMLNVEWWVAGDCGCCMFGTFRCVGTSFASSIEEASPTPALEILVDYRVSWIARLDCTRLAPDGRSCSTIRSIDPARLSAVTVSICGRIQHRSRYAIEQDLARCTPSRIPPCSGVSTQVLEMGRPGTRSSYR